MDDGELKFVYQCRVCGTQFFTGRDSDWTCDNGCAGWIEPITVEHWDCNGEFEYEETYSGYLERTANNA